MRQTLDALARFDASSVRTDAHAYKCVSGETEFTIVITTDRANATSGNAKRIVLNTAAFELRENFVLHELEPSNAWIELDDPQQVSAQLKRRWRKRRQEVFRGA